MGLKGFFPGAVFGAIAACALTACATGFGYKFYRLDLPDYSRGNLLGPTPADNELVSQCQPTEFDQAPCTCFLTPEFEAAKAELEDLRNKVKECQAPK